MLIPPEVFKAKIEQLTDSASSRYALDTVKVERHEGGRCSATVTDGRVLIRVEWDGDREAKDLQFCKVKLVKMSTFNLNRIDKDTGKVDPVPARCAGFSALVPAEIWEEAGKLLPKKPRHPSLRNVGLEETELTDSESPIQFRSVGQATGRTISVCPVDGKFPETDDAFPDLNDGNSVTVLLNPNLLIQLLRPFASAFASASKSPVVSVRIPINHPTTPVRIDAENEDGTRLSGLISQLTPSPEDANQYEEQRAKIVVIDNKLPAEAVAVLHDVCSPGQLARISDLLTTAKDESD